MTAHTLTRRRSFANIARTMRSQYALTLNECRLSPPIEPLWGRAYRLVEWVLKGDSRLQRRVVPADCTPSQIADEIKSHVPGRRFGPHDDDD
jgi:hypothetical protein